MIFIKRNKIGLYLTKKSIKAVNLEKKRLADGEIKDFVAADKNSGSAKKLACFDLNVDRFKSIAGQLIKSNGSLFRNELFLALPTNISNEEKTLIRDALSVLKIKALYLFTYPIVLMSSVELDWISNFNKVIMIHEYDDSTEFVLLYSGGIIKSEIIVSRLKDIDDRTFRKIISGFEEIRDFPSQAFSASPGFNDAASKLKDNWDKDIHKTIHVFSPGKYSGTGLNFKNYDFISYDFYNDRIFSGLVNIMVKFKLMFKY